MSGIVFFGTNKLEKVTEFYVSEVGAEIWLEQEDCTILKHGNFLFGFCKREETDTCGILTFFFNEQQKVDEMYKRLKEYAQAPPKKNKTYQIYHFFAEDPDGRSIEFQCFLHSLPAM